MFTRLTALFVTLLIVVGFAPGSASAQTVPGLEPGIVASGFGYVAAPAETAILQFLLGTDQAFGYGGGYIVAEEEAIFVGEGTPAAEPTTNSSDPFSVTEEQLAPIVTALTAAGILEASIEVTVPFTSDSFGMTGATQGEILVDVKRPEDGDLQELVDTVHAVAQTSGLVVISTGAIYTPADCASLVQQAREEAIADARARAEGLAQGAGVALGDLVQVAEGPYLGFAGGPSCIPDGFNEYNGAYGAFTYPTFNPRNTEASVTAQVVLTYAIGSAT